MNALVPQWKYWKQIPSVEIWQAILLTMDREPRNYLLRDSVLFGLADCVNPYDEHYGITISGYDEKITIACANVGERGFPETRQSSSDEQERAVCSAYQNFNSLFGKTNLVITKSMFDTVFETDADI